MSLRSTLALLCQKLEAGKCAQENVLVCVPVHTRACVWVCVYLQCYYSSLTGFTLSSKSAGWCNKGVYLRVCWWVGACEKYTGFAVLCRLLCACERVCVLHCGLLDLLSTSSLVLPPSLPSACFTLLLSAHTLMLIQYTRHTHTYTHIHVSAYRFCLLITSPSVIQG